MCETSKPLSDVLTPPLLSPSELASFIVRRRFNARPGEGTCERAAFRVYPRQDRDSVISVSNCHRWPWCASGPSRTVSNAPSRHSIGPLALRHRNLRSTRLLSWVRDRSHSAVQVHRNGKMGCPCKYCTDSGSVSHCARYENMIDEFANRRSLLLGSCCRCR